MSSDPRPRHSRTAIVSLLAVALAAPVLSGCSLSARSTDEQVIDGKVYGSSEAVVFQDDYAGPPVVGRAVTRLPEVAPLERGNRTHDVRVDVLAREIEIAPGVFYRAWTFGGTVPGPVIHVREGDRITFTMKNRSAERVQITAPEAGGSPFLAALAAGDVQKGRAAVDPMPHSIDFHAATVAPDDKWRLIEPGTSIRFEWVANYPGVFIYHCGASPVLQHVAMGQYGIVIVSPKDGFPTDGDVDREYALVQSEFYLKPDETDIEGPFVFDMQAALTKTPSQVLFNGSATALSESPLVANAGERVRLYVHNVGPNDQSSLHVIGAIFDRVFYEANPRNDWHGLQTVPLGASNGAVLEFVAPEEGDYLIVDHEFADALKGAIGRIRVRSSTGETTRTAKPMKH
jgi:nitrite reductase (NO-forming)